MVTGGLELNANRSNFERRGYRPISRIIGSLRKQKLNDVSSRERPRVAPRGGAEIAIADQISDDFQAREPTTLVTSFECIHRSKLIRDCCCCRSAGISA